MVNDMAVTCLWIKLFLELCNYIKIKFLILELNIEFQYDLLFDDIVFREPWFH